MYKDFKRFFRNVFTALLVLIIMLTSTLPIWANEAPVPDFSQWAVPVLNEAERYGTFPLEWYYDSFRSGITEDRIEVLLTNTEKKLEQLALEKKAEFTPLDFEEGNSRGTFLTRLYNVIAQYNITIGDDPIEFFQEKGVLLGSEKGLELNQICTTEHAIIFTTRIIESLFNQFNGGGKGFAWKVENDGTTIYFLGSIHIGNNIVYPIHHRLKNAFIESDSLIVEANIFDQTGLEYFIAKAMYQDGTTLKDHVSEETYDKVLKVLAKYGIPEETYSVSKPWSLANDMNVISISNSQSLEEGAQSANLGIDIYFLSNAYMYQKPVIELEGIAFQADLFDNLSIETQEKYLNAILDNILEPDPEKASKSAKLMNEWLYQWKDGDIDGFKDSYANTLDNDEDDAKELENMIFGERDKNMADKIVDILESEEEEGTYFVVVGAGHFVLEGTIIDQLTEKGYTVEVLK